MTRTLPANPSLEQLKNQAKSLLKAFRAGDEDARQRFATQFPQHAQSSAQDNRVRRFLLADALLVLAREYGFASWPKLKAHVEAIRADEAATEREPPAGVNVQTAHWMETSHHYGEHPFSSNTQVWVRVDPPARARINTLVPGPHVQNAQPSHDLEDLRDHFTTASTWDRYVLFPAKKPSSTKNIFYRLLAPNLDELGGTADQAQVQQPQEEWSSKLVEQDGRSLFQLDCNRGDEHNQISETIWAEPLTRRIVRREVNRTDPATGKLTNTWVCDQYTYNQKLPEEVFDIPLDKPVVTMYRVTWEDLTSQQKRAIQSTIDRSDAAWCKADFQGFASVWMFDYALHLPGKRHWKARLEQQTGLWSRWQTTVKWASVQDRIPVNITQETHNWGATRHKVWRVDVRLHITWDKDGDTWEGDAEFYLRHIGRGFRIVHWEFPWEEIKAVHQGEAEPIQA